MCNSSWERGVRDVKETTLQTWKPGKKEGEEAFQVPEQVDAQWRLSPHGEPVLEQAPGRTCDPTGDPHWSSLFLKDCTLWEASTLGSLWRAAACGKDPYWRCLWWSASCGTDPMLEQGKSVRRKEKQRQGVMNWPQPPLPVPLHHCGRKVENMGNEVEPGEEGGVGRRCL